MEKKYQVFVSSTYVDLADERQAVIKTLMQLDCIPAGMELFPAVDEEQWEFIKDIIDGCDYYLLIMGGRYGSLSSAGISYTEMEYDYAITKGIKVIALLHGKTDNIILGKTDKNPSLSQKLDAFRDKVKANRLVRFWTSPDELPGLVATSLASVIKRYPAVGWVRFDSLLSGGGQSAENRRRIEKFGRSIKNFGLRSDLMSHPTRTIHDLVHAKYRYHVCGNFDGTVEIELKIEAVQDMMFWEMWFESDENSTVLKSPDDLRPIMEISGGNIDREVLSVPTEQYHGKLSMLFAITPMLVKGEAALVNISYRWPGFFNTLRDEGNDIVRWTGASANKRASVPTEFIITSDPEIGNLMISKLGRPYPSESLHFDSHSKEWQFSTPESTRDSTVAVFEFRLRLASSVK